MTAVFDLKNHHLLLDTFERKFVHSNFQKSPNLVPLATLFIPYKRQHKFSVIFVTETPTDGFSKNFFCQNKLVFIYFKIRQFEVKIGVTILWQLWQK